MTATLLFCMEGVMQSFGCDSLYAVRSTEPEPTFSCVLGIVLSALGQREGPIDSFVSLEMGVRVDRPGTLLHDYQTVESGKDGVATALKDVYYVADARFLVGLQGDDHSQLLTIHRAFQHPEFALFLGRACCVPAVPLWLPDGLRDEPLRAALLNYPVAADQWGRRPQEVRLVLPATGVEPGARTRMDMPLMLAGGRFPSYSPRHVRDEWVRV